MRHHRTPGRVADPPGVSGERPPAPERKRKPNRIASRPEEERRNRPGRRGEKEEDASRSKPLVGPLGRRIGVPNASAETSSAARFRPPPSSGGVATSLPSPPRLPPVPPRSYATVHPPSRAYFLNSSLSDNAAASLSLTLGDRSSASAWFARRSHASLVSTPASGAGCRARSVNALTRSLSQLSTTAPRSALVAGARVSGAYGDASSADARRRSLRAAATRRRGGGGGGGGGDVVVVFVSVGDV